MTVLPLFECGSILWLLFLSSNRDVVGWSNRKLVYESYSKCKQHELPKLGFSIFLTPPW